MSEDLVERVAQAIRMEPFNNGMWTDEERAAELARPLNGIELGMARAAIDAMREATFVVRDETGVIHELRGDPMDTWRLLIDAALQRTS